MSKTLYVGNLSWGVTEDQVRELFEQHGSVVSIRWITDRDTGRFRGFCFVEMETADADKAASALNNFELDGRALRVNEAQEREDRRGGGSGGRRRSGGYRDRNDRRSSW
ncbi:MAG: RNA recognition motif domain-containing protein [Anaerolineae bacterium]